MSVLPVFSGNENYIPFCDRRFKVLRLMAGIVSRIALSLIFGVLYFLALPFHRASALKCMRIADDYEIQSDALTRCLPHYAELVDFAVNAPSQPNNSLPEGIPLRAALAEKYGAALAEKWSGIMGGALSLDEAIIRESDVTDGCCCGLSFHFLYTYFQGLKWGLSPAETIRQMAGLYSRGAPKEAVLAQIFYTAIGMKIAETATNERLENPYTNFIFQDYKTMQAVADRFGVVVNYLAFGLLELPRTEVLKEFIQKLPPGAYMIGTDEGSGGHVRVFIKTEEGKQFIYDSNLGTLAVDPENATKKLLQVLEPYFGAAFLVTFSRIVERSAPLLQAEIEVFCQSVSQRVSLQSEK